MSVLDQISDAEIRAAAFSTIRRLRAEKGVLTAQDLQEGFQVPGTGYLSVLHHERLHGRSLLETESMP